MENEHTVQNENEIGFKPESKFVFYELFCLREGDCSNDPKLSGNIKFPIVETILIENGQLHKWLFVSQSGEILKRNTLKLSKESIMMYFINKLLAYFKDKENHKVKKSELDIFNDINRLSLILERYDRSDQFPDEYEYLKRLNNKKFIYPRTHDQIIFHPANSSYFTNINKDELLSIFELNKLLNDSNKLAMIKMIQSLLDINLSYNPIVCRFYRKTSISQRKLQIYTLSPSCNKQNTNFDTKSKLGKSNNENISNDAIQTNTFKKYNTSEDFGNNDKNKKYSQLSSHILSNMDNMILMHNSSLNEVISRVSDRFIKLIEMNYNATMIDGLFRFLRVDELDYLFFSCERIILKSTNEFPYFQSHLPHYCEIKNKPPEIKVDNKTLRQGYMITKRKQEGSEENKFPLFGSAKVYEKLGYFSCWGEFCRFNIPKHFKNLKNLQKDKKNESKTKAKVTLKNEELCNKLSYFIIKKVYDNPSLVNMLLKSYKIFPPNVDKILMNMKDEYLSYENKKVEKTRERNQNNKNLEYNTNNTADTAMTQTAEEQSDIPVFNVTMTKKKQLAIKKAYVLGKQDFGKTLKETLNNNDNNEDQINTDKQNRLYIPTPNKFRHINSDKLYSEVKVCENCYIIYLLLDGFINNINEKDSSFKDIYKAKTLLGETEKPGNHEEIENPNIQFLYKEDLNQFDLKKILKNQIKFETNGISKIKNKNVHSEKADNHIFSYKMEVNPKIMNFNLAAENKQNKFFKVIFDQIHNKQDELSKFLGIKSFKSVFSKSMTALRMHMGINSSSGYPVLFESNNMNSIINTYGSYFVGRKTEEKVTNMNDKDLFNLFKQLKKPKLDKNSKSVVSILIKGKQEDKVRKDTLKNHDDNIKEFSIIESINSSKRTQTDHSNYLKTIDQIVNTDDNHEEVNSSKINQYLNNDFNDDSSNDGNHSSEEKIDKQHKSDTDSTNSLKFNIMLQEKIKEIQQRANNDVKNKSKPYKFCLNYRNIMSENERNNFDQKHILLENKKVSTQSIFYYDWLKENNRFLIPNYYTTTPLTYYNEVNAPIYENQLIQTREIKIDEFYKILVGNASTAVNSQGQTINNPNENGNFTKKRSNSKFLSPIQTNNQVNVFFPPTNEVIIPKELVDCEVFVYDQFTAVPFKITEIYNKNKGIVSIHASNDYNKESSKQSINKQSITINNNKKTGKIKFLVIAINDFFDSFTKLDSKLEDSVEKSIIQYISDINNQDTSLDYIEKPKNTILSTDLETIKYLRFNLPGQPYTIFKKTSNQVFNNIYYADFIDKFLFFLQESKLFDKTYNIIFIGFGNGGHIALTYASLYEKYWDVINSIILFNSYLENDDFISKSMFEILKIIEATSDVKLIDFFIRSITENPNKLIEEEDSKSIDQKKNEGNNLQNQVICSLQGFLSITKGYFYNFKINLNDITTPIFCVHSNQNCFITINNLNKFFSYLQAQTLLSTITGSKETLEYAIETNKISCSFKEMFEVNGDRKKLLIIDGCHDIFSENEPMFEIIIQNYFGFILKNLDKLTG